MHLRERRASPGRRTRANFPTHPALHFTHERRPLISCTSNSERGTWCCGGKRKEAAEPFGVLYNGAHDGRHDIRPGDALSRLRADCRSIARENSRKALWPPVSPDGPIVAGPYPRLAHLHGFPVSLTRRVESSSPLPLRDRPSQAGLILAAARSEEQSANSDEVVFEYRRRVRLTSDNTAVG